MSLKFEMISSVPLKCQNFNSFFPVCERKEFKLFQLLTTFDILLKKIRLGD